MEFHDAEAVVLGPPQTTCLVDRSPWSEMQSNTKLSVNRPVIVCLPIKIFNAVEHRTLFT